MMVITREIAEFIVETIKVCQGEGIGQDMNQEFFKCLQEEFPDLIDREVQDYQNCTLRLRRGE